MSLCVLLIWRMFKDTQRKQVLITCVTLEFVIRLDAQQVFITCVTLEFVIRLEAQQVFITCVTLEFVIRLEAQQRTCNLI